jgi:hypothetical protein
LLQRGNLALGSLCRHFDSLVVSFAHCKAAIDCLQRSTIGSSLMQIPLASVARCVIMAGMIANVNQDGPEVS